MIIKSPDPRGTWVPRPLFQRGESTQKSLMRHYSMLGVPIKKPDAPILLMILSGNSDTNILFEGIGISNPFPSCFFCPLGFSPFVTFLAP